MWKFQYLLDNGKQRNDTIWYIEIILCAACRWMNFDTWPKHSLMMILSVDMENVKHTRGQLRRMRWKENLKSKHKTLEYCYCYDYYECFYGIDMNIFRIPCSSLFMKSQPARTRWNRSSTSKQAIKIRRATEKNGQRLVFLHLQHVPRKKVPFL